MNIQSFAMISAAYSNPTVYGDLHGVNYLVWLLSRGLADPRGTWQPTPGMIAQKLATYRGSWRTQMRGRVPHAQLMETVLFYLWGLWREGLMLVGMAFFKTGIFSAARSRSFYGKLIGVAVFIGIPITIYGSYRDFTSGWISNIRFFAECSRASLAVSRLYWRFWICSY